MRTNQEMFAELDEFIASVNYDSRELIAILHKAQEIFGYLPMVVQSHIASKINVNVSKVYGVVTFYSFFTMEPKGEYIINICLGTTCFVRGAQPILEKFEELLEIKNGQTSKDGKFTITSLRCVGACALAPVVQINGKTYGNVKLEDVPKILAEYQ
jgi:NADH:ubiquinone oxidoreductase subunit E